MAKHRAVEAVTVLRGAVVGLLLACSPEATRTRDGGPGADPGNKRLVETTNPDPRTADTTLMPGRAKAPVDRQAAPKR